MIPAEVEFVRFLTAPLSWIIMQEIRSGVVTGY